MPPVGGWPFLFFPQETCRASFNHILLSHEKAAVDSSPPAPDRHLEAQRGLIPLPL